METMSLKPDGMIDTNNLCRLCLKARGRVSCPLIKADGSENNKMITKIQNLTTLKIDIKHEYPSEICLQCNCKIEDYYKFRDLCLKNDVLLKTIVENRFQVQIKQEIKRENNVDDDDKLKNLQSELSDETTVSQKEFDLQKESTKIQSQTQPQSQPQPKKVTITQTIPKFTLSTVPKLVTLPKNMLTPLPRNTITFSATKNPFILNNIISSTVADPSINLRLQTFDCDICQRQFRNSYTLKRHMNLHTDNLFECEFCHKKFNDRSNLKIHIRSHTREDLCRCAVCLKTFISPSTLKYHLRAHKNLKVYGCRVCFEEYDQYYKLENHMQLKHLDVKFDDMPNIEEFMASDLLQIQIEDDNPKGEEVQIKTEPLDEDEMAAAVKLEPLDEDEIGDAEHVMDSEEALLPQMLQEAEHAARVILFRCDICLEIFNYFEDLNEHMEHHKNEPTYTCEICSKKYRTEDLLRVHTEQHASDEKVNRVRKCNICVKSFKCELNLEAHMKKRHCGEPNSLFSNNSSEDEAPVTPEDISRIQEEQRKMFKRCEICATECESQLDLELHVADHFQKEEGVSIVHHTDRPYKCTECNKRFKRKDYLLIHIRTHTGERRYKCDLCSSAFVHPSNLITHRKLHSDERPFKCDLCHSAFKLFAGLKIHRRRCVNKYTIRFRE